MLSSPAMARTTMPSPVGSDRSQAVAPEPATTTGTISVSGARTPFLRNGSRDAIFAA